MNKKQEQALLDMLWDQLPKDSEHRDRVVLGDGWGTKTKIGLLACIERVFTDKEFLETRQ